MNVHALAREGVHGGAGHSLAHGLGGVLAAQRELMRGGQTNLQVGVFERADQLLRRGGSPVLTRRRCPLVVLSGVDDAPDAPAMAVTPGMGQGNLIMPNDA